MADNQTTIQGIARNVEWRAMGEAYSQLTFRIEVTDEVGNVKEIVPVAMVGVLKGNLSDGDEVKMEGVRDEDGNLKPDIIDNITTGGKVGKYGIGELIRDSGAGRSVGSFIIFTILAWIFIIIFLLVIIYKARQPL